MRSPLLRSAVLIAACLFVPRAFAAEPAPTDDAALLAAKVAAIDALQREVDQLRIQMGQVQQLMFHVKCFEVDVQRVKNLGIDWAKLGIDKTPTRLFGDDCIISAEKAEAYRGMLNALCRKNVARLISDPTLVTVSGRQAQFHEGGQAPVFKDSDGNVVYRQFGTQCELTANFVAPDRLGGELCFQQSMPRVYPSPDSAALLDAFDTLATPISFDMKLGNSILLQCEAMRPSLDHDSADGKAASGMARKELVLLITPELVEPMPTKQSAVGGPQWQTTLGGSVPAPTETVTSPSLPSNRRSPAASSSAPEATADRVGVGTCIAEINLDKMRAAGHNVKDANEALELLGLVRNNLPFGVIEDHAATEKRIEPFLKDESFAIVSSPTKLTLDGQEAAAECGSLCPVTQRKTGHTITLTPRKTEDGKVCIAFTGSFTAPKPIPAGFPIEDAKHFIDVREVQTTLSAEPGQTLVVSSVLPLEREVRTIENGMEKISTEEILAVYFITVTTPERELQSAARAVQPK